VKAEGYERRRQELGGWPIEIETYQVGEVVYCMINNVDPGARFARAEASTREEAEKQALAKAERYLAQTRRHPTS
jgi:uncharacterized protein YecE (DUF72 family)